MILRIPFEYPQVTVVRVAAPKWLPEAPRASASVASAPATQVAVAERELETQQPASFVDVPIAEVVFAEPLPEAPEATTSVLAAPATQAAVAEPELETQQPATIVDVPLAKVVFAEPLPEAPEAATSVLAAPATQVAIAEPELETQQPATFVDVPLAKVAFAEPLPEAPKTATSFVDALIESAEKLESGSLQQQSIPVPPPVKKQPQPLGPNVLSRGWSWLKQNQHFKATKQLRVLETVSLGEKRFIALVHVEGQRFLIGGGASNVCLLTQLGSATNAVDALQPVAQAGSISE